MPIIIVLAMIPHLKDGGCRIVLLNNRLKMSAFVFSAIQKGKLNKKKQLFRKISLE
jgi:hypothetical protein